MQNRLEHTINNLVQLKRLSQFIQILMQLSRRLDLLQEVRWNITTSAVQNRLEHTINNLDTAAENLQTAESRIRDTDMAEEMVNYSKNNILAQAGQSMLAQANQSNQGVLTLLQ